MLPADPLVLANRIRDLHTPGRRLLIGIVGAPGSGKSTLCTAIVDELASGSSPIPTALVPMDGYHLAQRVLDLLGIADIKGAPETFDGAGYVALLKRLSSGPDGDGRQVVYAPEFRRAIEEPIAGAVPVTPDIEVVITEGNYLLATDPPWNEINELLTESWYLDTPEELRVQRLVSRHVAFGRSPDVALLRSTTGPDGRNAAYVLDTRPRADLVLRPI